MQKTYNPLLQKPTSILFVALLTLLMSACGGKKAPEHTKLIPKDAIFVARFDIKQLTSKTIALDKLATEENLQQMGASKKEAEKASKNIKKFLDSGIDFLNNFYFFSDELNNEDKFGLTFALDNEAKFSKFIQNDEFWKNTDGAKKPEYKEDGKIKFAVFDDKKTIIAWQGKTGLLLSKRGNSTNELKKYFGMKDSETLLSNASFKDFTSKAYDASIWIDFNKVADLGGAEATMAMGMAGISNKDTYLALGFTFDKGKILMNIDYTGNESIEKMNNKIANSNISSDILKNIPLAEPTTGFSFSIKLDGFLEYLKERGQISVLDKQLRQIGITSEDLAPLTGDVFGASSTIKFDARSSEVPVEFVISLGIKDKKSFEALLDKINNKTGGVLSKEGNTYSMPLNYGGIVVTDKAAYITPENKLKDNVKAGKNELKGVLKDNVGKYASVVYVGKGFFDALVASKIYRKNASFKVLGNQFPVESVLFTAEKMKNKKAQSELTITLTDKSKNSLLTLIDLGKKISEEAEKQRKKYEDDFKVEMPEDETVLEEK